MRNLKYAVLICACCFSAIPALAGPADLWVNMFPNMPAVSSNYGEFLAGPLDGLFGPTPANMDGEEVGPVYCIDIHHELPGNPSEYAVVDNLDTTVGFNDQPDRTGDLTQAAWLVNNYGSQMTDPYLQASMQVAIWQILYPSYQYYSGLPDVNEVSLLESASAGQHASHYQWFDYQGPTVGGQDMLGQVPEPASLLLLGSGLMGLALVRFRRR